jgi:hypothetical protein
MRQVKAELHFTVNIDEEDGCYWAEVVEIPGCFVWGRSMEEIRAGLTEAMHGAGTSTGMQVVLRDLQSVRDPARRARAGAVAGRTVPAVGGRDDRPLGELVSLASRRPAHG